jgi:molybdate transport system substrate-binding protein
MNMQGVLKAVAAACLILAGMPARADAPDARSAGNTLNVAVAASVQYVFTELQAEFQRSSGVELKPSFSASGKFAAQIMNGAPFDVFLSADMEFPEKLYQAGYAVAKPQVYAYGTLVLWSMKDLDMHDWRGALTAAAVNRIALANPQTAPFGRAAVEALRRAHLEAQLQPKLVYGESIAQTDQYIYSGVAEVGFTAKSVVLSPELKGQGKWIDVPEDMYEPIAQGVAILKHGQDGNPRLSRQFVDFLSSQPARAILARYGYLIAP